MKHSFVLDNLNCANCAAKIENKIASTEGYKNVSFNFATKKLNLDCESDNPIGKIQAICDSIEDGVTVRRFGEGSRGEHRHGHNHEHHNEHGHGHSHEHSGHCGDHCGCHDRHEHEHDHEHRSRGNKKLSGEQLALIASAVFTAASVVLHLVFRDNSFTSGLVLGLCIAATLMSGWEVMQRGVKNLFKLRIDENFLMTVAVIAAFALGEYVEAAAVAVLFSLGEMIEDKAVERSRRGIEKLSQIRPDNATVLRGEKEETVHAADVEIGTEIIVKPHERIPLDGVVTAGSSTLDLSALTGESVPVRVAAGSAVMSGAVNGDSLIKLRTTKEFGQSTASRILTMVEDAAAQKGGSERFITRFAAVYTPVMIGLAVLIAVVPPLVGLGAWSTWIYNALVVLVASCPCAIVISVPLSYYSGIGAASKMGVLIKGGKYLEALARTDAAAFDKTGTLTDGNIEVKRVYSFGEYSENEVLTLAASCEKYSTHPIAKALLSGCRDLIELDNYREVAGVGVSADYKGKTLVCGNERSLKAIPESAENAGVFLTLGGELIGAVELSDRIRPESARMIEELKEMGIRTVMLTGDDRSKAQSVADRLKITEYEARLMPGEKLGYVQRLKEKSKSVCFVGDGINDAPVLAASDCGVAMGLGSEAAIEAADAVLSSGTPEKLPAAIRLARRAMRTIRSNIIIALSVKLLVIVLACFGLAAIWMSVIADTGVCVVCVLFAARLLRVNGCRSHQFGKLAQGEAVLNRGVERQGNQP